MTYEGRPNMERFEFNATPEQAGEAIRQLDRIMADIPPYIPPASAAQPLKNRTYTRTEFTLYPEGRPDFDRSGYVEFGAVAIRHDDDSREVFTIRRDSVGMLNMERRIIIDNANDPRHGGRSAEAILYRASDGINRVETQRVERDWGFAEPSFTDAETFLTWLRQITPLDPRANNQ